MASRPPIDPARSLHPRAIVASPPPILRLLAALVGLVACVLVPVWPAGRVEAATDQVTRVVELTNAERAKAGLAPLTAQANLNRAAGDYAALLASVTCFAHTCGPVPEFSDRAVQAGYSNWTALAENIAAGQRTPEAVVAAWMESPGHRANILNPKYTEIGVGVATGGQMGIYWAQEFGSRRGVPAPPPAPAPAPAAVVPVAPASPAGGGSGCGFVLGFASLRAMLGAGAGECLESEHFNTVNGNAEQLTTGGMFVWRKSDNWTAFTDGYRTWINGPQGLQSRLNAQRFVWESDAL